MLFIKQLIPFSMPLFPHLQNANQFIRDSSEVSEIVYIKHLRGAYLTEFLASSLPPSVPGKWHLEFPFFLVLAFQWYPPPLAVGNCGEAAE